MNIVHQCRSGAPDKIMLWTDGSYDLRKHDNTNLVCYTEEQLLEIGLRGEYILPADEGDIKHANAVSDFVLEQDFIMLPQVFDGEFNKVIDYQKFVPKNSDVYKNLEAATGVIYPQFETYTRGELLNKSYQIFDKVALKTTTGSGSRGVWIIDRDRVRLGNKCVDKLTKDNMDNFMSFCINENCDIILQELCPINLLKCNTDFVIKEGRLITYKWDCVNQDQQFTNWDNGEFIRTEYTDSIMAKITAYLVSLGIVNAIMNFESYSNLIDETWMIEFNWRYSNSMFEGQALGIDLISSYLTGMAESVPMGKHKFSRFWQCKLYSEIKDYHYGL